MCLSKILRGFDLCCLHEWFPQSAFRIFNARLDYPTNPALSSFHAGSLILVGRGKMGAVILDFGRLLCDAEICPCIMQRISIGVKSRR